MDATGWVSVHAGGTQVRRSDDELPIEDTGRRQHAGWFRFHFDDDRWEWSPEVEVLHGYQPGTVAPTTELVLSHKHPDDLEHIARLLAEIRHDHRSFSSRHRIIDTAGTVHHVIVVADTLTDADGAVVGTRGFYVDVTPTQDNERRLTAAIAEIAENRAVIEQAKGMLMVIYGITADAAFDLLRWRSQEANVKLRRLAEQVVDDFVSLTQRGQAPGRAAYDNLLLTADRRIEGPA
jgi:PAS domain S-box-containing protein